MVARSACNERRRTQRNNLLDDDDFRLHLRISAVACHETTIENFQLRAVYTKHGVVSARSRTHARMFVVIKLNENENDVHTTHWRADPSSVWTVLQFAWFSLGATPLHSNRQHMSNEELYWKLEKVLLAENPLTDVTEAREFITNSTDSPDRLHVSWNFCCLFHFFRLVPYRRLSWLTSDFEQTLK